MRSRLLMLSVAAAAVLADAPGMAFAQTPAQAEQAAPASIPRWARVSFFADLATATAADGSSSSFSELVTNVSAQSVQQTGNGFEYGLDARFGAYPSTEDRDPRTSIYDAYVGQRLMEGQLLLKAVPDVAERPWRPELGRRRAGRIPGPTD